MLPVPP